MIEPHKGVSSYKKTKLARLRSLWAGRRPAVTTTREGGNAADRERIETHLDDWSLQGFSAAIREAARPEGRVLAPAVRDTGFTVGNTRRPCRIERPAAAIIGTLKKKTGSLTLAMGWPLASLHNHYRRRESADRERNDTHGQVVSRSSAPGFLVKCSRIRGQVFQESWSSAQDFAHCGRSAFVPRY